MLNLLNKIKVRFLLLVISHLIVLPVYCTDPDTLIIPLSQDAKIDYNNPGSNYGSDQYIVAEVTSTTTYQSLLQFDLSSLPGDVYVMSAKLTLYGIDHLSSGNSNESVLKRVTSSWEEGSVSWENKPSTTSIDAITLNESNGSEQNYEIDITLHVRDMILNNNNYGFLLQLDNPAATAFMRFASIEHSTSAKHPKVEIIYKEPDPLAYFIDFDYPTCGDPGDAGANLHVTGGGEPYSYEWRDEEEATIADTPSIAELNIGKYQFIVTDYFDNQLIRYIGIGYPVEWNAGGYSDLTAPYSLEKVADNVEECAGGYSRNILLPEEDGWVEFTIDATNQNRMFGFTDRSDDEGDCWSSIDYGFYLNNAGDLIRVESGEQNSLSMEKYFVGDVIRLERSGDDFRYYKNGDLLYTSYREGWNSKALVVDASFLNIGDNFSKLRASFDLPFRVDFVVTPNSNPEGESPNGAIDIALSCTTETVSFLWSTDATTEDLSSIDNGSYWVSLSTSSINNPPITYTIEACTGGWRNWADMEIYDENGTFSGHTRIFYDELGREIQVQSKILSDNEVLAYQTVYDNVGREAIKSLTAPIEKTYIGCYNTQFMTASNYANAQYQVPYTVSHFDENTGDIGSNFDLINKPVRLDNTIKGSLGKYYSNNNVADAYVPADGFPYSRKEYHPDPLGRIKRSTKPGGHYKLGSGHETQVFYSKNAGELAIITGGKAEAYKVVIIDEEGKEIINYTDIDGRVIATCRSGLNTNSCNNQFVSTEMNYYGNRAVNIHVPASKRSTVKFPLNTAKQCTSRTYINYKIIDLQDNVELEEGSGKDYLLNTTTGQLTFNYKPGKSLFLAVSFQYTDEYINDIYLYRNQGNFLPSQFVEYELDYGQWTLNEYDPNTGNLLKSYPPLGVDCDAYEMNVATGTEGSYEVLRTYIFEDDIKYDPINHPEGYDAEVVNPSAPDYTSTLNYFTAAQSPIYSSTVSQSHDLIISLHSYPRHPDNEDMPAGDPCTTLPSGVISSGSGGVSSKLVINGSGDYWNTNWGNRPRNDQSAIVLENGEMGEYTANDYAAMNLIFDRLDSKGSPLFSSLATDSDKGFIAPRMDDDEGDPCEGLSHCFNNMKDEECGETAVDIGGGCPYPKCYNIPPKYFTTFQMVFKVIGEKSGSVLEVLDEKGDVAPGARHILNNNLYTNCECEYFWDQKSLGTASIHIPDDKLVNYIKIHIQLEAIMVRTASSSGYVYVPYSSASFKGEFARFLQFTIDSDHRIYARNRASDISHTMPTEYGYNDHEMVTSVTTPDVGKTENVYNSFGQLRFSQNSVQQAASKFTYYNYDKAGRVVETGEFSYATTTLKFQNEEGVPAVTSPDTSVLDIVDLKYPLNDAYSDQRTYYKYDIPDVYPTPPPTPAIPFPFNETEYNSLSQNYLLGKLSKSWTEDEKIITWYSYDMMDRLEFTIQYIADLDEYKSHHYTYDNKGYLTQSSYQTEVSADRFDHHYTYDSDGRVIKVESSVDGSTKENEARYTYYAHGPLKREVIGEDVQGIDYVYTITGQLKSINSPKFTNDPGKDYLINNNAVATDVFGMTIDYHLGDYNRGSTYINYGDGEYDKFNGQIQSIRWNIEGLTAPGGKQWMYEYQYDEYNRLVEANFGTYYSSCQNLAPGWFCQGVGYGDAYTTLPPKFQSSGTNEYRVWGIEYDLNGNLKKLKRNAYGGAIAMDDFSYSHYSNTNRLSQVADACTTAFYTNDIENGQSATNYSYDSQGQLIADALDNRTYEYDYRGLPTKVYENAVLVQDVKYDALGKRLKKLTYSGGSLDKEIYYIRDITGNITELREVNHGTSPATVTRQYAIYGFDRLGYYDRDNPEEGKYELKDHLGNIRVVIKRDKHEPCSTCVVPNGSWALVSSYADYYPWGMEMPGRNWISGSSNIGKFAFQGKETDEATGLTAFDLRFYDGRLGRWLNPDPYRQHYSPYLAMSNSPTTNVDPDGGSDYLIDGIRVPAGLFYQFVNSGIVDYTIDFTNVGIELWYAEFDGERRLFMSLKNTEFSKLMANQWKHDRITAWEREQSFPDFFMGGEAINLPELTVVGKNPVNLISICKEIGLYQNDLGRLGRQRRAQKILDDAPDGYIPIIDDLKRASYWYDQGDGSRTALYTVSAISDIFLIKTAAKTAATAGLRALARSAAKRSSSLVKSGTTGYRYMSHAELTAIRETGYLRGGLAGETYFTKDIYKSASKAQSRLSLGNLPELRVEFNILNSPSLLRNGTKVSSANGMIGGGSEFMTLDRVRVSITNWQPIK